MIEPTQEEFDAWREHPVSQFVAAAYQAAADQQRAEWERYFDASVIPAELSNIRLELKTREDAYRAFAEATFDDFLSFLSGPEGARQFRAAQKRPATRIVQAHTRPS